MEKSMIPNTIVEELFLRVASDSDMQKYNELVTHGHIALATAYASKKTRKLFYFLIEFYENRGGNIDFANAIMSQKDKTK